MILPRRSFGRVQAIKLASSNQQRQLAAPMARFADSVGLGEGEGPHLRKREAPGFDQRTDLGEQMESAVGVASAESHSILLRASEARNPHDVLRTTGELDEVRQDTAASDVKRQVDTAGSERSYPIEEALAV